MTYEFLQQYWWFLVSLLGALLVFLMFVQGGNSLLFSLGHTVEERRMLVNSTGRKWELTFTTLVTFGGAFFASFPLFYSTSFGGAYWLWMIILFSFVLQAVSYEFQNKLGNFLGPKTFQWCLVLNGIIGPLLIGGAVATFFYVRACAKHLYPDYRYEGFFSMFGMLTGTASNGMILLREIDPKFETPAANNLVLQTIPAIVFGFPVLLLMGFGPQSMKSCLITLGILAAAFFIFALLIFRKKLFNSKSHKSN